MNNERIQWMDRLHQLGNSINFQDIDANIKHIRKSIIENNRKIVFLDG